MAGRTDAFRSGNDEEFLRPFVLLRILRVDREKVVAFLGFAYAPPPPAFTCGLV